MSSLQSMKVGKLLNCRIELGSGSIPAVLKKVATRADGQVEFAVVVPKRHQGRSCLLDGKLKANPDDVIIKHRGYTLS